MATSKDYLEFALEQLSGLDGITHRQMMGEYIIYYRGKIIAYLCDNRFLLKPTPSAKAMLPGAVFEPPYSGAKEMILFEQIENRELLISCLKQWKRSCPSRKRNGETAENKGI